MPTPSGMLSRMPTPAEQKALAFVALIVLLGSAVRVVRGGPIGSAQATVTEQRALVQQLSSASGAAVVEHEKQQQGRKSARKAPRRRYAGAKFDSTGLLIEGTGVVSTTGFPPPGPRIDLDLRAGNRDEAPPGGGPASAGALIDVDVATAAELERLPGIGPALARRIVGSRDSLGRFGALSGLRRVKGLGPATIRRLAPLVTFSGQTRR